MSGPPVLLRWLSPSGTIHEERLRPKSQAIVNLHLVHTLLAAAHAQPYGFLKVRGADLAREVELMASAGLVEASPIAQDSELSVVINRVTDSGHAFLRAFKNQPPEAPEQSVRMIPSAES